MKMFTLENETIIIELFASDLTPAAIQKFKDRGVWNENWDIMPLTTFEFEPGEE